MKGGGKDLHRWRVAYHEAGHAVLVVACSFKLGGSFIAEGMTTASGGLGGYTYWGNPLDPQKVPNAKSFEIHGSKVASVLLAGQEAEKILAASEPRVAVADSSPDWISDNTDANDFLASMPNPPSIDAVRHATSLTLQRLWRAVAEAAAVMLQDPPDPVAEQVVLNCGRTLVPAGRTVDENLIKDLLVDVQVAEGAYLRWRARGCEHGQDVQDWLAAEREFRRSSWAH